MCRFILWMIVFLYAIGYSEAQQSITAIEGIIHTRNYQTATFEWEFHFPENSLIFMEILMVDKDNKKQKGIVFKTGGGQFQAYDNMKDRVKISIPPSRRGVTLDISNIVISDGGRYMCTARLRSGREISNISLLVVIVPPRINKFQRKVYRDEGFNASLLCQLDAGSPRPLNFQWFRIINGVKVVATPVVQRDSNQTFYIPNVGRPSLGKYRCEVGGLGGVDRHTVDLFVRYKPVITAPPLNRTVLENFGTEQLRCTAAGNAGDTTYHWYKDHPFPANEIIKGSEPRGIQIAQDRKALKFIRPPRKLDTMYFCTGSNLLGMGKPKGAHLNVTYKPGDIEILTTEGVINGIEGENMTVKCYSDANPPAYYNWFKIVTTWWGSTIREHIVKYSYTGDLKLYRVDKNDTANYICVAANRPNDEDRDREYVKKKTVTINVRYGPRQTNFTINDFNQSHSYIEVKQYEKVTIRCVSHSEPGADYNIRREKVMTQLNSNTKVGVYVIERIETTQEGVYVCISSNSITKKHEKLKIRLIVAVAPVKVDPYPGSKILQEGATISIDCHAKGKPPPKVYWQRYGANITHNDSVIQTNYIVRPLKEGILSIVDAELKFTGIRYTDDASYSCIMWNAGGQINLTRIRYVVQYTPKLTKRPENFTRTEGKEARFVCQAKGNPEAIQWTWKFNDVEVPRVSTNTFFRSFTNRDDNGKYECVPRNSVGNGQIGTGYLEVQYEPEFTKKPDGNYTVDVTETVVLRCEAKAVPTPRIKWIKYLGGGTPVHTGNTLTLERIKPEDRGQYNCIASNIIRSVSTKTLIIVRHKPIITTRKPSDTKVGSEDGAQVTLRCDVDAYPAATVQWKDFIDKTIITHGSDYHITEEATLFGKRSTLRFTVHSYQLGKDYLCSAKNLYGADSVRYQVLVKG